PETAEELLEQGVCDFVGVGRGHIADPQWVRKAKAGKTDEIRKCLGCLYCFESLMTVAYPRCSVNPRMSREHILRTAPEKNGDGRKVAVVGGGAAGMQASALLAQRGFDVTLFEKNPELGGCMKYAAGTAPYKVRVQWFRDTLQQECEKAGVDIRLNTEATIDAVKAVNPEAVFLGVGGTPIRPASIPGINAKNVVMYHEVLDGKVKLSGRIAVIGGGLTGLETAEYVCHNFSPEKLVIADMLPQIGTGIYPVILADVMYQILPYGPELLAGHALAAVTDGGVCLTKLEDQSTVEIPVDYVVLAMGVAVPNPVIKEFEDNFDRVVLLGETRKSPGRIGTSVADGYLNAYGFDPDCG
ncbi:MAG: FAD-dependent oxidoreductase, partial [Oscillospiraceae bacterium]|nr:FAD-dependent oxidoreductase [Oscillospiraceae bacterium]